MPSAAAIILNNGTVDVTFSPDSVTATHVVQQNLAEPVLAMRQLFHLDRPISKDVRRAFRINLPVEVTLASGEKVIKTVTFKGEMVSPTDVPALSRTQVRVMASNALKHAAVVAVFDNPEWVW